MKEKEIVTHISDTEFTLRSPSLWARIGGPLITLVLAALIELLAGTPLRIPNPPAFFVLAIVFSAFSGGLRPGLLSALIAWAYIAYFFSQPDHPFRYTDENLRHVIVWALTTPLTALLVGLLSRRAARALAEAEVATVRQAQLEERARLGESRMASERRFRALIEKSSDGIALVSPEGTITYASPAASRIVGCSAEERIGRGVFELIHPYDLPTITNLFAQVLSEPGASQTACTRVRHKDGTWRWIEAVGANMLTEPSIGAIIVNFRDITTQVQAERQLTAESSVRLVLAEASNLTEATPPILQAICEGLDWERAELWSAIWHVDRQANVLHCGEVWQKPPDAFPEFDAATRRIEFAPGVGLPGRVWATGAAAWIPDVTQDPNFPRAAIAAKEGLRAALAFPLRMGSEVLGVMAFLCKEIRPPDDGQLRMMENIGYQVGQFMERRRADEDTRQNLARYQTLVEQASDGIFVADSQGRYIDDVNTSGCAMLGYTREEILKLSVADLIAAEDLATQPLITDELRAGEAIIVERLLRRKDGTLLPTEVSAKMLPDGRLQGMVRDITERQQREYEMKAVAKMSAALRHAATRAEMVPVILDRTRELLHADGALLATLDAASGETVLELGSGNWADITGLRIPAGQGVTGQVIATGRSYMSSDLENDPRVYRPEMINGLRAGACVPLTVKEETFGALWIARRTRIAKRDLRLLTAIADIAANALYRATLHEQTEKRLGRIDALRTIDMAITSSLDPRVTLNVLLDQVTARLGIAAASVLLLKPRLQMLEFAAGRGFRTTGIERSSMRLGAGHAGCAALERRVISIPNLAETGPEFVRANLLIGEGFVVYCAAPLISKGRVTGVLETFHRESFKVDPEWIGFLEALAAQAAIAIDNAGLFDDLQRSNVELSLAYDGTIEGWSRALDLRDKETEGHSQRVTEMTLSLAGAMGMSEEELVHARRGALLHDIGKMGVPDSILLKPGPLTEEEWTIMRKHPQYAYEMLLPIGYLRPALDIPYCHHEKWDGAGYGRGLKGNHIPLAARIFSVVDVWDALRSDRPYRKGWSEDKTREYICANSGTHFDPQVAGVFLQRF